jgi:hypothetical protein
MTDNDKTWVTKSEIASHIGKSEKTIERLLKAHPQLNELRVKRDRSWYYPLETVQKYLSEYFPPVSTTTSVIETEVIETENVQEDPVTKSEETENEVQKLRDVIERRNSFLRWVLVGNFFDGLGIEGSFADYINPVHPNYYHFMKVLEEIGIDVNDIIDKHFIFIEEQARINRINQCNSYYNKNTKKDFQKLCRVLHSKRRRFSSEISKLQTKLRWFQLLANGKLRIDSCNCAEMANALSPMGLDVNRLIEHLSFETPPVDTPPANTPPVETRAIDVDMPFIEGISFDEIQFDDPF